MLYLAWLALGMARAAWRGGAATFAPATARVGLARGFLTSFLNPKGLLMYLSVMPLFVDPAGSVATQSLILASLFLALCAMAYGTVALLAARAHGAMASARRQRAMNGAGAALLGMAAGIMAAS